MARGFIVILLVSFLTVLVQASNNAPKYTHNLKVRYYTNVEMQCDHMDLNVSSKQNVKSLGWIFPDGRLVNSKDQLDPKKFQLSGPSDTTPVIGVHRLMGYELHAFNVDDDMFGYYTCVVVIGPSGSGNGDVVYAIRWGLNVDGADFSELLDTYKKNAIIGGIAAAVTLGVIVGAFLIWYFYFNKEDDCLDTDPVSVSIGKSIGVSKNDIEMHENNAYINDKEDKHSGTSANTEQPESSAIHY